MTRIDMETIEIIRQNLVVRRGMVIPGTRESGALLDMETLLTHIDAITAQVATLLAACENARDALLRSDSRRLDPLVRDALDWISDALRDSGGDTTT